ncbi:MAG: hypothetical protein GC151_17705 [Betaproteobacteria bacterium]|nr:hypothetical protein [Betaproteobacteria bacterium]
MSRRNGPVSSHRIPLPASTGGLLAGRPARLLAATFAALAFAGVPAVHALADETPQVQCPPSDDSPECKADRDERVMMYDKGRAAYDRARTDGDFTEAFSYARKLYARHDKNGERLLKMTYMQLGWGHHKDYVQAYRWLSQGIDEGIKYLPVWREKLAEKMTPEQLEQAKKQAGN